MFQLTLDDIKVLIKQSQAPAVSIYIPTSREPDKLEKNRIRLKNQIDKATDRLQGLGLTSSEASNLLEPAHSIIANGTYTAERGDGLALFISQDFAQQYVLPYRFEEETVVGRSFQIKQLLPLLTGNGRFYILALSQNKVRLLEATREAVEEVSLEGIPTSLAEGLQYDDPERQLQYHTGTAQGGDGRGAIYHGHGAGEDELQRTGILRFFQLLDDGLQALIGNSNAPILMAGVEFLPPIYREASKFDTLLDDILEGNPETLSADELHAHAWPLVQEIFAQDYATDLERFHMLKGEDQTTAVLENVVSAAAYGRVDTLFVALDKASWGSFDVQKNQLERLVRSAPAAIDLFNYAAEQTLVNGGSVYALSQENLPFDSSCAAILRY